MILTIFYVSNNGGAWRSLVARLLWEQKALGSNPSAPTIFSLPRMTEYCLTSQLPPLAMASNQRQVERMTPAPKTDRQAIAELLAEHHEPLRAREIAEALDLREREVEGHLAHVAKSCKKAGQRLRMIPAKCQQCGFVFEDRQRRTVPGKCPSCRGQRLARPLFTVS